ncbi:MAG: hypothetical protein PHT33_09775, partial [bacterium]|nr:hypothetical protein [bacterium]
MTTGVFKFSIIGKGFGGINVVRCPICGYDATKSDFEITNSNSTNKVSLIVCKLCGDYLIDRRATDYLEHVDRDKDKDYILSGYTRYMSEKDKRAIITRDSMQTILETAPIPKDPIEAMDRILLFIAKRNINISDGFGTNTTR